MKPHAREEQRILEVCCASVECVIAADAGGGDRIELCENLDVGGLTPSEDLLKVAKAGTSLQVFVLIRCRAGDFRFTGKEVSRMVAQIENVRHLGADGIVCGALTDEGEIDEEATSRFITAAGPLPFTFHRAFDALHDQSAGLALLRELGAERILSSAGLHEACEDPQRLQELVIHAGGRPGILACGGIRSTNIGALAAMREIREFHSAASSGGDGVDVDEVRAMKDAIIREY
ncbi:MAG: copper homeostasis protein CutC [Verrucomicrobiales bacterium]